MLWIVISVVKDDEYYEKKSSTFRELDKDMEKIEEVLD